MRALPRTLTMGAICLLALASAGGCWWGSDRSDPAAAAEKPPVWLEEGIKVEGYTVELGHRDHPLQPGGEVEPVVQIAKDGEAAADAMVFYQLVSADGQKTIGEEVATVYDAGCYAQAKLRWPAQGAVAIRYRLVLPDVEQAWTKDVVLPGTVSP